MRALNDAELNEVSGGDFTFTIPTPTGIASNPFDSIIGAVAGGVIGANTGMIIGGIHGGDGGGVLGIGSIGQAVGLVVPTIQGAITGFVIGGIYGFSHAQPWINKLIEGTANGTVGQGGNAAAIRI